MSYIPFDQKYRIRNYSDIFGHKTILNNLRSISINREVPTSQLFIGTQGTGKSAIADMLARSLYCKNQESDGSPCCKCEKCKNPINDYTKNRVESGRSSVFKFNCAKINSNVFMHDLLRYESYGNAFDNFRLVILDEANILPKKLQYAMLNLIEDARNVKFIFTASSKTGFHEPFVNRCREYIFSALSQEDAKRMLISILTKEGFSDHPAISDIDGLLKNFNNLPRSILLLAEDLIRGLNANTW